MAHNLFFCFRQSINKFFLFKSDKYSIPELMFYYSLYATFLVTFISFVTNFAFNRPPEGKIIGAIGVAISIFLFWLAYVKGKWKLSRTFFFIYLFLSLNTSWFVAEGSAGPILPIVIVLLVIVVFYEIPSIMWRIVAFTLANLIVLYAIEINFPQTIMHYPKPIYRSYDSLIVAVTLIVILIPLLYKVKGMLMEQRNEAVKSEELKTSFFMNLSHEIRTPMNAILGFSELMDDDDLTAEERRSYLSIINVNGRTLLNLLNNVINFSKLESQQTAVSMSNASANELVAQVYHSLRQAGGSNPEVDFRMNCPEPSLVFKTDVLKAYQILLNITFNAIKFTEKGFVEIGYHPSDHNTVTFYVKDTGCGIPADARDGIFDRYWQAGQTLKSSASNGAGLGLAICKRLATLLNSHITLESHEGRGTTFFVTMPLLLDGQTAKTTAFPSATQSITLAS